MNDATIIYCLSFFECFNQPINGLEGEVFLRESKIIINNNFRHYYYFYYLSVRGLRDWFMKAVIPVKKWLQQQQQSVGFSAALTAGNNAQHPLRCSGGR